MPQIPTCVKGIQGQDERVFGIFWPAADTTMVNGWPYDIYEFAARIIINLTDQQELGTSETTKPPGKRTQEQLRYIPGILIELFRLLVRDLRQIPKIVIIDFDARLSPPTLSPAYLGFGKLKMVNGKWKTEMHQIQGQKQTVTVTGTELQMSCCFYQCPTRWRDVLLLLRQDDTWVQTSRLLPPDNVLIALQFSIRSCSSLTRDCPLHGLLLFGPILLILPILPNLLILLILGSSCSRLGCRLSFCVDGTLGLLLSAIYLAYRACRQVFYLPNASDNAPGAQLQIRIPLEDQRALHQYLRPPSRRPCPAEIEVQTKKPKATTIEDETQPET